MGVGILVEEAEGVVRSVLVMTKMKGRVTQESDVAIFAGSKSRGLSLSKVVSKEYCVLWVTHAFTKHNEKIWFSLRS